MEKIDYKNELALSNLDIISKHYPNEKFGG